MQDSLVARIQGHRLLICGIAGIAILFAAVPIGYNAVFLANSEIAAGTAVETGHELRDNTKGSRPAGSSLVIEFTTAAGRTERFDGDEAASSLYIEVGDRVPVRYDPDNPDHAVVDRDLLFFHLTVFPLLVGALGVALLLAVGWTLLISRNQTRALY
ncbi:uncharacterized protein DUF3592 [Nocardia tenerifensis]|uniref:Uncharacterized protein DUF3592 n=1 Tax=Nocardia tenerifensis TaxID=228006 RepID=A0A318JTR4_9NOCA|nr:DUF3592 domain-containing protein [Nocardia tenerifensis]PXX54787.1 uncharacterized protein DUF3592 [Nocardia tenerifensis]